VATGVDRRSVLKRAACLGLALPLLDVSALRTVVSGEPDPATARPQPGDQLVLAAGDGKRDAIAPAAVPLGGPPRITYPMDPTTKRVRDGSRLNQILLVHLDSGDLAAETRARAAAGIVAYSAVCTHTGCDVWDWDTRTRTLKCPCHFSVFDVKDAARILDGPAPRRLPALPLKIAGGVLVAAGGFVGRPGFQQGGA
jgi:rieske iron-sulfur protein